MWKIFTAINTILLLLIIGGGIYCYTQFADNFVVLNGLPDKVTALEGQFEEVNFVTQDGIAGDLSADDVSPEDDTLKLGKDSLKGFTTITGYLSLQDKPVFDYINKVATFVFPTADDQTLIEYLGTDIPDAYGYTKGGLQFLALGCDYQGAITGGDLSIKDVLYAKLKASSSSNPVTLRVFFNDTKVLVGDVVCASLANNVQVVEE